jgi:large subunit ribosomal protein L24
MARQRVHVRRGDHVKVIAGNYKGVTGQVLSVIPAENRVIVEGVNVRKRHQRPSQQNPEGGIVTFEASIDASNVMLIDPTTEDATRVRTRVDKDGTKERISVRSGNPIPTAESTRTGRKSGYPCDRATRSRRPSRDKRQQVAGR